MGQKVIRYCVMSGKIVLLDSSLAHNTIEELMVACELSAIFVYTDRGMVEIVKSQIELNRK